MFIDFLKIMVNKYSYKLSKEEASKMTIGDAIDDNETILGYFHLYQKVARF